MSGPIAGLVDHLLEQMSGRNEFSPFISNDQRGRIIRGLFHGYYGTVEKPVIFDTNRSWCVKMDLLAELFPECRVIACVRHVPWIIDSIERYAVKNPYQPSLIYDYKSGGTVFMHVNNVTGPVGIVGYAYDALRQAVYGRQASRIILVQYESLVEKPGMVMDEIYKFIGEPAFQHDFNNVHQETVPYDEKMGAPGLHYVKKVVENVERKTVLPPDIFNRFENHSFWRRPESMPKNVTVL